MTSEALEKLKAQRPDYSDKVGETSSGDTVINSETQDYFIDSLLEYLEEADKGRIYQRSGVFDGTNYVITQTSLQPLYVFPAITPKSNETSIFYSIRLDARIKGASSQKNIRGRFRVQFKNSVGSWQDTGINYFLGHDNLTAATTNITVFSNNTLSGDLGVTRKNPDGDWEIRITAEVDYSNNSLETFSALANFEEKMPSF